MLSLNPAQTADHSNTDNSASLSAAAVEQYLQNLQQQLLAEVLALDPELEQQGDQWQREEGGGGRSAAFANGKIFEKGGINFSHVMGQQLPPSATASRPELVGRRFRAMGVSVVLHPHNPHAPTSHCNVRFFIAEKDGEAPVWWFGGGYDLTPYYGYQEDCQHWHATARNACAEYGEHVYPALKQRCDEYFYLKHRNEARGIGGLFFDDLNQPDFNRCFEFMQSIGNSYFPAYLPIIERRHTMAFNEQQRQWQNIRRGRYVEFNLVWDRGTLFGLQSGGRTESILMSLPPQVHWQYQHEPQPGSEEAKLLSHYLPAKDWLD